MKKVVDAGALRSVELADFLTASPHNVAVITDYTAMESFKGRGAINIRNSLQILSQHPEQVVVLKSTSKISFLAPRRAGLHSRFIDRNQTSGFAAYCRMILHGAAQPEDIDYDVQLKEFHAKDHFAKLAAQAEPVRKGMIGTLPKVKSRPCD